MSIKIIHQAALTAPPGSIDTEVFLSNTIDRFSYINATTVYVNVPVDTIVALNHKNFWEYGQTWRDVTQNLIGPGWGQAEIAYFSSPLKEKKFPPFDAHGPLQMSIIGGACYCSNGNHRLVAGRALLSSGLSLHPHFRLVKARYYALDEGTKKFLRQAVAAKAAVKTATVSDDDLVNRGKYDLILQRADQPHLYYGRGEDDVVLLRDQRSFLGKLLSRLADEPQGSCNWVTTPVELLSKVLDDEWITNQLPSAESWG